MVGKDFSVQSDFTRCVAMFIIIIIISLYQPIRDQIGGSRPPCWPTVVSGFFFQSYDCTKPSARQAKELSLVSLYGVILLILFLDVFIPN